MESTLTILVRIFTVFMVQIHLPAQQLDVEGDVKIRGNIDINHPEDTTSVFIGRNAGLNMDFSSTGFNTFMGSNAGFSNMDGYSNTFIGQQAGFKNMSGATNTFVGSNAGFSNMNGTGNTFFGRQAGYRNTTGWSNVFFGEWAGLSNTTGSDNAFFGRRAGSGNTTGTLNVFLGHRVAENIKTGTRNTFLGALTNFSVTDSLDRAVAIGFGADVLCSKCAVIGETGSNAVKVGLGTSIPTHYLTLVGSSNVTEPDFAITSQVAIMELGSGQNGPHGFSFGDSDNGEGIKLFYRTTPNELRIEPGNDISDNTTALFRFGLDGKMFASGISDIGNQKTMKYDPVSGEIGFDNSSRRYKTSIQRLADDWIKILQVRPVKYTRPRSPEYWEYGYIAEEMDSIGLTNLVGYDAEGRPDDVKYDRMVLYLTEMIKLHEVQINLNEMVLQEQQELNLEQHGLIIQQQKEITRLKESNSEIKSLKKDIDILKSVLSRFTSEVNSSDWY